MNILLNIALTPSALQGKGPVTVQATAVSASDLQALSFLQAPPPTSTADSSTFWNGNNNSNNADPDSPLDLVLSRSEPQQQQTSSRVTSSSGSASHKHSATSSLAGVAGECSPAKQSRMYTDSAFHHHSPYTKPAGSTVIGSSSSGGVKRSGGQYEGSRRKLNPAYLTHIKPRSMTEETGTRVARRLVLSSSSDPDVTLTHTSAADDDHLMRILNLKQEVE
jgi:hypothetical protein